MRRCPHTIDWARGMPGFWTINEEIREKIELLNLEGK